MYSILVLLFLSISLSTISAIGFLAIAEKIGIIDVPSGRKRHQNKTPLVGGLIIFMGCLAFPFYRFDVNWFFCIY